MAQHWAEPASSVAKDRSWFGHDYRPITSQLGNIIGLPILDEYNVLMAGHGGSIKELSSNRQVAHFKSDAMLLEVRLSGPPIGPVCGPSPFEPNGAYMLSVHWPESERMKHINSSNAPHREVSSDQEMQPPPSAEKFTAAEKKWLKDNYGGEFRFLRDHGLSIYEEDDRAEGQAIMRAMMLQDEDDEDVGTLAQMSPADYAFSSKQLAWIRAEYSNSETFMLSYGLKFYNSDDVEEAVQIAKVMMAHDD